VLGAGVVRWLVVGAARRFALDNPNERSLHSQPVPRLGGVGILCGALAGWALVPSAVTPSLWVGAVLLGVVSLVEDVRGVPAAGRFLAHFVAAGYFVHATCAGSLPWLLLFLVVVGIVWVTNLYNFMDGSDGLAGGMAVFGFGAYGIGAWSAGAEPFGLANACIAGASAGFLLFNFAPAKIFMGDSGSIPLGFLAASFGVFGWQHDLWPAWFPLLVFSPFLVDASVTLIARLLRREKVWRAHRSHYYQRLVLMGWGHRKVALAEYGLMLVAGTSALAGVQSRVVLQAAVIVGWLAAYGVVLRLIDVRWRQFKVIEGGDGSR
jgi:UDP-N-acetylmuramyl pentapeptide phosphotransferase/UDP-N-acetylglucosamine-1-phosphate transferase